MVYLNLFATTTILYTKDSFSFKRGSMVNKALPIAIIIIIFIAVVLAYFFFVKKEITIGEPFRAPYLECVRVNSNVGGMVVGINANDPSSCKGLDMESFCRAIVTKDAGACGTNIQCKAIVTADASLCGKDISCKAFIAKNENTCREFKPVSLDAIRRCAAFVKRDEKYFASRQAQQDCLDVAYFQNSNTSSVCAMIVDSDLKKACLSKFT